MKTNFSFNLITVITVLLSSLPSILYFSCNFYFLLLNIDLIFSARFRFGEGEHLIDVVFFFVSYEKKVNEPSHIQVSYALIFIAFHLIFKF